jgi:nitrate reductase alpha subunit
MRKRLMKLWREAKLQYPDPVTAWGSIVEDPAKCAEYKQQRGLGGFVRADWQDVNEMIGAANAYTTKTYGPDRVVGFSPIPAMSMVSYAAGARYLSLMGGHCLSFYDWYCDLPPASPQIWGEQTDVPESADWFNSNYIIVWGSNVPQTRTRSMIIVGAALNHWYHMNMSYRGLINMLMMCGCVGQSGGSAHYAGQQEKLDLQHIGLQRSSRKNGLVTLSTTVWHEPARTDQRRSKSRYDAKRLCSTTA